MEPAAQTLNLGRVPDRKDAALLVVAKDAQGGDVEVQRCGRPDLQLHPGNRDCTKDVAVREREDAAVGGGSERDKVYCPRIDLCRCLAAGTAVLVKLPTWARFVDRLRCDSLVLSVIDLAKQRRQLRVRGARDLGRTRCALKRARVHGVEVNLLETVTQRRCLLFTMGCKRKVGVAGVAAVEAPFGLAVAGEIDLDGAQAGLPIISGLPERRDRLALSMTAPARTRWPGRMHTNPTVAWPPCSFIASLTADRTRWAA